MQTETLELKKSNAIEAYNSGDEKEKALLVKLYGKQHFITNIMERCTTLEDACRETGKDMQSILSIADPYDQAEAAIKTFAEALREGKPASECWYYPYFNRSSGGGFSYCDYDGGYVGSGVGARLRVDSAKKAEHLGRCLLRYYQIYVNGQ